MHDAEVAAMCCFVLIAGVAGYFVTEALCLESPMFVYSALLLGLMVASAILIYAAKFSEGGI